MTSLGNISSFNVPDFSHYIDILPDPANLPDYSRNIILLLLIMVFYVCILNHGEMEDYLVI